MFKVEESEGKPRYKLEITKVNYECEDYFNSLDELESAIMDFFSGLR